MKRALRVLVPLAFGLALTPVAHHYRAERLQHHFVCGIPQLDVRVARFGREDVPMAVTTYRCGDETVVIYQEVK